MTVQPYCSIGTLTRLLGQHNLQLPVTPEMDQLTVGAAARILARASGCAGDSHAAHAGGLCLGYGIESSSHVHGLFFDAAVLEVEFVTADGEILTLTPDNEHADLFRALQWSYGCLGFAATFKLRLVASEPFVKLTLERCNSFEAAERRSRELCESDNPPYYFEALAFSPQHTALIYGTTCAVAPADAPVYDPWSRWYVRFPHSSVLCALLIVHMYVAWTGGCRSFITT